MSLVDPGTGTADAGGLALLSGPDASAALAAAVATAGGQLLSARATSVDHRPASGSRPASTTVAYRARVRWADGERSETLAATTAALPSTVPPGVVELSDGRDRLCVWRFRDDPGLPALSAATDPVAVAALLASFGVTPSGPLRVTVRAYRPRRRAVVEVTGHDVRLFLKVLRPAAVEALHARHALLHAAGVPVPRSLGWSPEGLLLLSPLPGGSLREAMRAGTSLPPAAELVRVLDALPDAVRDLPSRASWTDGVGHYATVVAAAVPALADRVHQLARAVVAGTDPEPGRDPTHGDYYETQLLVAAGVGGTAEVTGVLDVDTAGPGRRADDLACLLAHASLLAEIEPGHATTTAAAVRLWWEGFAGDSRVDPDDLRHRVAGVLVSLATGPHRVQQDRWEAATSDRLDLVERWLGA